MGFEAGQLHGLGVHVPLNHGAASISSCQLVTTLKDTGRHTDAVTYPDIVHHCASDAEVLQAGYPRRERAERIVQALRVGQ